jgi:hypothetical protein
MTAYDADELWEERENEGRLVTIDIGRASASLADMIAEWYGNAPLPNARISAVTIATRLSRFEMQPPVDAPSTEDRWTPEQHLAAVEALAGHKWLDPECAGKGCQSLIWKSRYESAVMGRSDFRQAYRAARAAKSIKSHD